MRHYTTRWPNVAEANLAITFGFHAARPLARVGGPLFYLLRGP